IAFPDAQNYAEHAFQLRRLQQAFATCGMGLGPKLRASNFEPPAMSELCRFHPNSDCSADIASGQFRANMRHLWF
ncbi:MAG: hypothetical protein WBE64_13470, partial [Xanthobacteraceae bacterium]